MGTLNHIDKVYGFFYLLVVMIAVALWASAILSHDNVADTLIMSGLWSFFLYASFVLTGFEVAYTDLRDKEAAMLSSVTVRGILPEMQENEAILYESKEWLAVLVTVGLTLIAEWHFDVHFRRLLEGIHLKLGPIDIECLEISSKGLATTHISFVLLFTTVPLLFLAQGPAKRLAARNSERFLERRGVWSWQVLRTAGKIIHKLQLPAPSELLVRIRGIGPRRSLTPSLGSHFMASLKRFSHCHQVKETIVIHRDGSASETVEFWLYRSYPRVDSLTFRGSMASTTGVSPPEVSDITAVRAEAPGEQPPQFDEMMAEAIRTSQDRSRVKVPIYRLLHSNPTTLTSSYELILGSDPILDQGPCVIHYTLTAEMNPGSFTLPDSEEEVEESQSRAFDWPCRRYELRITVDEEANAALVNPTVVVRMGPLQLPGIENERVKFAAKQISQREVELKVDYPLAARYELKWLFWRLVTPAALADSTRTGRGAQT